MTNSLSKIWRKRGVAGCTRLGKSTDEILKFIQAEPIYTRFKPKHIQILRDREVEKKIVSYIEDLGTSDDESGGSPAIVGSDSVLYRAPPLPVAMLPIRSELTSSGVLLP